jgi:hypothetical protein
MKVSARAPAVAAIQRVIMFLLFGTENPQSERPPVANGEAQSADLAANNPQSAAYTDSQVPRVFFISTTFVTNDC